jgi:hypothetical protein
LGCRPTAAPPHCTRIPRSEAMNKRKFEPQIFTLIPGLENACVPGRRRNDEIVGLPIVRFVRLGFRYHVHNRLGTFKMCEAADPPLGQQLLHSSFQFLQRRNVCQRRTALPPQHFVRQRFVHPASPSLIRTSQDIGLRLSIPARGGMLCDGLATPPDLPARAQSELPPYLQRGYPVPRAQKFSL